MLTGNHGDHVASKDAGRGLGDVGSPAHMYRAPTTFAQQTAPLYNSIPPLYKSLEPLIQAIPQHCWHYVGG